MCSEAKDQFCTPTGVAQFTTRRRNMKVCMRRSLAIAMAATVGVFFQGQAAADIFAVSASEPAGHSEVFRLDERSGVVIERWTVGSETVNGIAVSMLGDVYVAGNTLGSGVVFRFSPTGDLLGQLGGDDYSMPSAVVFGPQGDLYALSSLITEKGTFGQVLRFDSSARHLKCFIPAQPNTAG